MTQRSLHHIHAECRTANRIGNNVIITTCVSERDPIVVVTDTIITYNRIHHIEQGNVRAVCSQRNAHCVAVNRSIHDRHSSIHRADCIG